MKIKFALLSIVAVLALAGGHPFATFAQSSQSATKAASQAPAKSASAAAKPTITEHVMQGSVVSMTAKSIVIRNKGRNSTFLLNPETKETGNIAVKKEVTVHYHDQNRQHIATSIQEMAPAATSKSKG
jgi:hypothetical protein